MVRPGAGNRGALPGMPGEGLWVETGRHTRTVWSPLDPTLNKHKGMNLTLSHTRDHEIIIPQH